MCASAVEDRPRVSPVGLTDRQIMSSLARLPPWFRRSGPISARRINDESWRSLRHLHSGRRLVAIISRPRGQPANGKHANDDHCDQRRRVEHIPGGRRTRPARAPPLNHRHHLSRGLIPYRIHARHETTTPFVATISANRSLDALCGRRLYSNGEAPDD
jgi:hypothetical protein